MSAKAKHKELKRAVNEMEQKRKNDRSTGTWYAVSYTHLTLPTSDLV